VLYYHQFVRFTAICITAFYVTVFYHIDYRCYVWWEVFAGM